jgi:fatty acid desaturase
MNDPHEDLDREIDLGHHGREEAREWARTLIFVALATAALMAILWLGGAF